MVGMYAGAGGLVILLAIRALRRQAIPLNPVGCPDMSKYGISIESFSGISQYLTPAFCRVAAEIPGLIGMLEAAQ